ncbi:MAG TPA: 16S rRNA (uracil(1498)-N(3))-methyltransferase, partial [Gammaproteobacteria bacterium]|nr:16S rRNA (uracil(1498)-N(3))-methyltransferase [Gammaproteobacteria bacterium]
MRIVRIYTDQPLPAHSLINLPEASSHHLSRVLRMRTGGILHVFNGRGGCHEARISAIAKQQVEVQLLAFREEERESNLDILLAQGVSRGQHMDYTIQKAVELGVKRIVPVLTGHGNVSLKDERIETRMRHWEGIVIHACEQCGRNRIPTLDTPVPFCDWLARETSSLRLILDPESEHSLATIPTPGGALRLLCGPEGGFSRDEVQTAFREGYCGVRLGPRVLR